VEEDNELAEEQNDVPTMSKKSAEAGRPWYVVVAVDEDT